MGEKLLVSPIDRIELLQPKNRLWGLVCKKLFGANTHTIPVLTLANGWEKPIIAGLSEDAKTGSVFFQRFGPVTVDSPITENLNREGSDHAILLSKQIFELLLRKYQLTTLSIEILTQMTGKVEQSIPHIDTDFTRTNSASEQQQLCTFDDPTDIQIIGSHGVPPRIWMTTPFSTTMIRNHNALKLGPELNVAQNTLVAGRSYELPHARPSKPLGNNGKIRLSFYIRARGTERIGLAPSP